MPRITIQYADILPQTSMEKCNSCDEPITDEDGDKYVVLGYIARFHVTCFEQFILGLLEFQRLFIFERQQDKIERKLN